MRIHIRQNTLFASIYGGTRLCIFTRLSIPNKNKGTLGPDNNQNLERSPGANRSIQFDSRLGRFRQKFYEPLFPGSL